MSFFSDHRVVSVAEKSSGIVIVIQKTILHELSKSSNWIGLEVEVEVKMVKHF